MIQFSLTLNIFSRGQFQLTGQLMVDTEYRYHGATGINTGPGVGGGGSFFFVSSSIQIRWGYARRKIV